MIKRYTVDVNQLEINEYEALRYLGYVRSSISQEDIDMVKACIEEVRPILMPKACYDRYDISVNEDGHISMPYGEIVSHDLVRNMLGCKSMYMFAATIGPRFDMALNRARAISISKAAVYQSVGAAAVEALCDKLNVDLANKAISEGEKLRPRYSPGFGDMPLENQRGFFKILTPERHIGLTLKDNLIMAPEKSVTALIGIE